MAVCKSCGRSLDFVRTARGRMMPCEVGGFMYRPDPDGKVILDDETGRLTRGYPATDGKRAGHMPHFGNCPDYKK